MPSTKGKKGKNANARPKTSVSVLAYNTKAQNRGAKLSSVDGVTRVAHREVVSEAVVCGASYGVTHTVAIQPAVSTYSHGSPLGSWLPKIAAEYDHYQFNSLKLHYVPTCATTQAGLIVMACDPNPDGFAPESFSSMKNMKNAVTGPARERLTLDVTSQVIGRKLLTRDSAVQAYPLYDAGRLFVASIAGTDVSTGYLEVEYVITLSNPQTGPRTETTVGVAVIYPATVYMGNTVTGTPGTQRWVGTTNASKFCGSWMYDTINSATSVTGSGINATLGTVNRTAAMTYIHPYSGVTYSTTNGFAMPFWTFNQAGRYRFTAKLAADWQNFATFGCDLISWSKAGGSYNPASTNPLPATDVARNAAGAIVSVVSTYSGWRGLRTVDSGGTDDCDFVPEVDITFVVETGDRISFVIGVRNDSSISQNGDAWYLYDSRMGNPQMKLEYLGSVY